MNQIKNNNGVHWAVDRFMCRALNRFVYWTLNVDVNRFVWNPIHNAVCRSVNDAVDNAVRREH